MISLMVEVQRIINLVWSSVCCVLCAVCCVLCAVCCVLCDGKGLWDIFKWISGRFITRLVYFWQKQYKIRFEWADIIYDMSKAIHFYRSESLIPFYLIRQPALWIITPLSGGPFIRYELHLSIAKAFPLLKLIMNSTGWEAVSIVPILKSLVWPRFEPNT